MIQENFKRKLTAYCWHLFDGLNVRKTDDSKQRSDETYTNSDSDNTLCPMLQTPCDLTRNTQRVYFCIMCVTAASNPSMVSSNMGKMSRMAMMVRV